VPIVVAGRDVSFSYQWDRYTVQSTLGVAMLVAGVAYAYIRPPARAVFLLALMGSGVVTQYHAAVYYRELWNQERQFWWQLSWRVPGLERGVTLIAAPPAGYRFLEEYEVWGPLNIIYNPGGEQVISGQVPYDGIELDLAEGILQNRRMRGVLVVHDYSQPLVVSKPTLNSCLHVINGERLELPDGEDARISAIAPFSRIELVEVGATPKTPPANTFGREPQHDWCYYYQKIDLARQEEDWDRAAELAGEIEYLGLKPADRSEWLPVIEAHINSGDLERARELARKIKADKGLRLTLCEQLEATETWPESTDFPALVKLVCGGGE
jgi:hypothetical protein